MGTEQIPIETFRDRRLALPPLDEARASRLIARLDARPLLDGVRGAPPADVAALATALARLSSLAVDLGDLIGAIDVNPIENPYLKEDGTFVPPAGEKYLDRSKDSKGMIHGGDEVVDAFKAVGW